MFTLEQLVADCRQVLGGPSADGAIKEIVKRAVSDPAGVERALGTPKRAEIVALHRADDLNGGREDNHFFRHTPEGVQRASLKQLDTGDAALLGAQTIHAVTNPLARFTGAIHVYGGDFFAVPRSEFDPDTLEERPYDVEKTKRVFLEANQKLHA